MGQSPATPTMAKAKLTAAFLRVCRSVDFLVRGLKIVLFSDPSFVQFTI